MNSRTRVHPDAPTPCTIEKIRSKVVTKNLRNDSKKTELGSRELSSKFTAGWLPDILDLAQLTIIYAHRIDHNYVREH